MQLYFVVWKSVCVCICIKFILLANNSRSHRCKIDVYSHINTETWSRWLYSSVCYSSGAHIVHIHWIFASFRRFTLTYFCYCWLVSSFHIFFCCSISLPFFIIYFSFFPIVSESAEHNLSIVIFLLCHPVLKDVSFCERINRRKTMASMYLIGVVLCLAVSAHSASIKQESIEEAATRE